MKFAITVKITNSGLKSGKKCNSGNNQKVLPRLKYTFFEKIEFGMKKR